MASETFFDLPIDAPFSSLYVSDQSASTWLDGFLDFPESRGTVNLDDLFDFDGFCDMDSSESASSDASCDVISTSTEIFSQVRHFWPPQLTDY